MIYGYARPTQLLEWRILYELLPEMDLIMRETSLNYYSHAEGIAIDLYSINQAIRDVSC